MDFDESLAVFNGADTGAEAVVQVEELDNDVEVGGRGMELRGDPSAP